jgi:hypothetical protein
MAAAAVLLILIVTAPVPGQPKNDFRLFPVLHGALAGDSHAFNARFKLRRRGKYDL